MQAKSFWKKSKPEVFFSIIIFYLCTTTQVIRSEDYHVKRESNFEFEKKPKVSRNGDKITIAFETKGLCDVTVAIEDSSGKIIRHLVSGLLGSNAPAPFKKDSKSQEIIWDGKDDQEKYASNKEDLIIRVSLGLKPQFEKTLFHSPYKRFGRNQPAMSASPEGVYIYEGDITDNIRLFNHEGEYVQTVLPFANGKLKDIKGLRWRTTLDGEMVPFKEGSHQATYLGSGYNGGYNTATGFGAYQLKTLKHYDGLPKYPGANAIAIQGNKLALVGFYLSCLSTDGSIGGFELKGSKTGIQVTPDYIYHGTAPKNEEMMPRSAAFSPDGKWVYLTGYTWYEDRSTGGATRRWLHGVLRVNFENKEEPKPFIGSLKNGDAMAGNTNDKLNCPTAVASDRDGLVYVSDYVNNRIQIFAPDGNFKESIPVNRPAHVAVHQKTGEIYAFSWTFYHSGIVKDEKVPPKLTIFDAKNNHKMIAEYDLPLGKISGATIWGGWMGTQYRVELDSWADKPTIWMVPEMAGGADSWAPWGIKILVVEKNKLVVKKDFGVEANKDIVCDFPTGGRQRLILNPKDSKVYIMLGMGDASGNRIVEVDPSNNKDRFVNLPFGAEDICFDINGNAYLRTGDIVVRYDNTWKEIPWDYGVERNGVSHSGGRTATVISGLQIPGTRPGPWFHCGGFGISAKGHLVVQCFNGGLSENSKIARPEEAKIAHQEHKDYKPEIYPGRQKWGEIHIWDSFGKVVSQDVAPGISITDGVQIDKDDNVYVLTNPMRTPDGKQSLNPLSETLIKFNPKKGKVLTSGKDVSIVLPKAQEPKKPTDMLGYYQEPAWVIDAEWMFGGVGYAGTWRCTCWNSRFSLDYYARCFAPEPDRFSVAVLDTAGNLIIRIGKPGNVDDGKPLIPNPKIKNPRLIGGDETALMHACYVAVESDKRLLIEDTGNQRIASVKLGYYTDEKISLKDIPDQELKK